MMFDGLLKDIDKAKKDFDGTMNVNYKYILENIEEFNLKFNTFFTKETTKEEIIEYFKQDIYNIFKSNFRSGNVTQKFNNKYKGYAYKD